MRFLQRLIGIALMGAMLTGPAVFAKKKTPPDGRPKSVQVKGYKTKKGKTVKPYQRRARKSYKSPSPEPSAQPVSRRAQWRFLFSLYS